MADLVSMIETLRQHNEPVPHPRRLPSEDEVAAIERELGVQFHADICDYLLHASDVVYGLLEPVTISDKELHTYLPVVAEEAWELGVPKNLVPICEDNGDYYCIDYGGQIYFWSHNGVTDETWPDLATWIEQVWLEERSIKDEGEGD